MNLFKSARPEACLISKSHSLKSEFNKARSLRHFTGAIYSAFFSLALTQLLPIQVLAVEAKETHSGGSSHASAPKVNSDVALGWLKNGNIRYTHNRLRKDGAGGMDRKKLYEGQHPHSVILSCSDSRVPPELVFDQKLGEVFTVRTAGESLDYAAIASIEYAVEHLGPQLIVVMGHSKCGAVKAAIDTRQGADAGSEHLNKLVKGIHPFLKGLSRTTASQDLVDEGWANARGVAEDLAEKSKIIKAKLESGELKIVPSLYHLDTGEVKWGY